MSEPKLVLVHKISINYATFSKKILRHTNI